MKEKKGLMFGLLAIGVLAFFGFPYVQWFRYTMDVREEMDDKHIGRFPTRDDIAELEVTLEEIGTKIGYKTVEVDRELEYRDMGATKFWYLKIQVKAKGHSYKMERRVETEFESYDLDKLREDGVIISDGS
ncbi:MAG: hypothetical protein P1V97_01675 [Planctomycetota bacterium]|nr:hypothetical protein [Planctomycetota bacterium]